MPNRRIAQIYSPLAEVSKTVIKFATNCPSVFCESAEILFRIILKLFTKFLLGAMPDLPIWIFDDFKGIRSVR